jgi:hypothetical protein
MRFSRVYIEAACLILLFDLLRDPATTTSSKGFITVAEAIQCFMHIPADRLLLMSTAAISRMLDLTREIVSKQAETDPTSTKSPLSSIPNQCGRSADTETNSISNVPCGMRNFEPAPTIELGIEPPSDMFNNHLLDLSYYIWTDEPLIETFN